MKKLKVNEYLNSRELSKAGFLNLVAIALQGMYVDLFELGQIRWDHVLYEEYRRLENNPRLRKISLVTFILFAYYISESPEGPISEIKAVSELYGIDEPTNDEIEEIFTTRKEVMENITSANEAFETLGYGEKYKNVLLKLLESELLNA